MHNLTRLFILSLIAGFMACNSKKADKSVQETEIAPQIENLSVKIFDVAATEIIDSNAAFEILATGFSWSEGPLWVDELNAVLFSDVPRNIIYKWSEKDSLAVFLEAAGHSGVGNENSDKGPNGLLLDTEGNLLICQHGDRRIARMNAGLDNPQARFISVAEFFEGKKLNSPNDLAMDKAGNIYFTDPPYGQDENKTGEIGINGVFKVTPNGEVSLLVDSLTWPNGIALSLDEKTLFINQSDPKNAVLYSYQFNDEGKLINGKVLFDSNELSKKAKGLPDGLRVHKSGNIFATGPGGVLIISPEGKHLATINTGKATANCTFDTEQNYLYMTSTDLLMRVRLK